MADITIRKLKGNNRRKSDGTPQGGKQLQFSLASPTQSNNLLLSVPHRLLIIALRRDLLEGISTVKQLLEGDLMYIRVKCEFHQHPILVQSLHAGTELDLESTLPASALTRYLKDCARRNGFPDTVTLYSLRRQAASDFNAK